MQTPATVCSQCSRPIDDANIAFCPNCSCVVIDHSLLKSKSTANYDPTSREWKPWQDKPLIPKRDYKFSTEKPKPWLPTMRVQARRVPKSKNASASKVPPTPPSNSAVEHAAQDAIRDEAGQGSMESCQSRELVEAAGAAAIVNENIEEGKGRGEHGEEEEGWRPGGGRREDKDRAIIREVVYPLAAYDVSVQNARTIVMIVSLIEQLHGPTGAVRVYWLKISHAIEDDCEPLPSTLDNSLAASESSPSLDTEQRKDVVTPVPILDQRTVFLSNSQAMLFSPYEDWLDFDKIDADQFYVTQHMQNALQFLASRMTVVRKFEDVTFLHEVPSSTASIVTFLVNVTVEQRQSTWTALSYGATHSSASNKIMMRCRRIATEASRLRTCFLLDECIAEQRGRVKISRVSSMVFLPVVVQSFVLYANRHDSMAEGDGKLSKSQLRQSNRATHLKVCLAPVHDQQVISLGSEPFPQLDITVDNAALSLLLTGTGDLEDVLQACEGSIILWKQYVDRLLTVLRVEWTAEYGVGFSLVGAFCDPVCTSQPWPEGMVNEEVLEGDGEE